MTFELLNVTPFAIVFLAVAAIAVAVAVGALATFFARNATAPVRRHQSVARHHGHLLMGR